MKLNEKVAIITGSGSGLGKEAALLFAKEGATVVVADFDETSSKNVVSEIEKSGGKAMSVVVNVANRESVDAMVESVVKEYGRIDILINNAGITKDKTLLKLPQEDWQAVIDVNLTGVFNCGQSVARVMREQGSGKIVNTSSIVGVRGNVGQTNYAAAKAGVIGMTQSWAKELAGKGLNINAVAPGFIATPMTEKMPPHTLDYMKEQVPMKRLGTPKEVANVYLFLASEDASYINGAVIPVDGALPM